MDVIGVVDGAANPAVRSGYSVDTLLRVAQRCLDVHAVSSVTGRCLSCEIPGPCGHREAALAAFHRFYLWGVPRRTPGATLPGLIGRAAGARWRAFGSS